METINLTIPNMKSSHCQISVSNAVKMAGGSVKNITPMKAEIELGNSSKEAVIQAIESAGYKVNR